MNINKKNATTKTETGNALVSYAQTLLNLAHEANNALREGRLGAKEWFEFLNSIEMLAKNIQLHEAQQKKSHLKIVATTTPPVANNN